MTTHSSNLAWEVPWTGEPGGLQSTGSQRVRHNLVTLQLHGLQPIFLCPGNSPGKNTGVGCHSLLQGTFPTQGSNLGLLHHWQILYNLSYRKALNLPGWREIQLQQIFWPPSPPGMTEESQECVVSRGGEGPSLGSSCLYNCAQNYSIFAHFRHLQSIGVAKSQTQLSN